MAAACVQTQPRTASTTRNNDPCIRYLVTSESWTVHGSRMGVLLLGIFHKRSIPSRSLELSLFRCFAVQLPAFGRIDIAQRACVRKVELDDIAAVVWWWAGMATRTNPHGRAWHECTAAHDAAEVPTWGAGTADAGAGAGAGVAIVGVGIHGRDTDEAVSKPFEDGNDTVTSAIPQSRKPGPEPPRKVAKIPIETIDEESYH